MQHEPEQLLSDHAKEGAIDVNLPTMAPSPKNGWNTVGKEWFESKDKLHKANFVWIGKIIPDSDKEAEEKKFQAKHDKKARMLSAYCRPKPKGKGKAPAK